MYKVNISFFVESKVQNQWLDIIKHKFIPLIIEEGYQQTTLSRVITEQQVGTAFTYALMVEVETLEHYKKLTGELFNSYVEISKPMFGERVLWHTTLLKNLDF